VVRFSRSLKRGLPPLLALLVVTCLGAPASASGESAPLVPAGVVATPNAGGNAASVSWSPAGAQQISADAHVCAVMSDDSLNCWGQNVWGEVGDGFFNPEPTGADAGSVFSSNNFRPTPYQSRLVTQIRQVAAGGGHTCVLQIAGTIGCWGFAQGGQLGGSASNYNTGYGGISSSTPVQVQGINTATQVVAGPRHTCALLSSGQAKCWGDSNYPTCITGGYPCSSSVPVLVPGISNATSISTGGFHSCALLSTGRVKCWGANWAGQLGDGNRPCGAPSYLCPATVGSVEVAGISNAIAVSSGESHNCAILSDRTMKCWGTGADGELGDGVQYRDENNNVDWAGSPTPVTVTGISNAIAVSAGNRFSCALLEDRTVICWGRGDVGQLGDGAFRTDPTAPNSPIPVAVQGLTSVEQISAGYDSVCAVRADHSVVCWGSGYLGTLGNGTVFDFAAANGVSPDAAGFRAVSSAVPVIAIDPSGGTPILSYTATASPGGQSCTTTPPVTNCTIDGLITGRAYTVRVRATNQVGPSNWSSESVPVVPSSATSTGAGVAVPFTSSSGGSGSVVFGQVTVSGSTSVAPLTPLSPAYRAPSGFSLPDSAAIVDVQTSAVFTGQVQVCVPFNSGAYPFGINGARLFHFENGTWRDVTTSVNRVTGVACGLTTSLSPFAVGTPTASCIAYDGDATGGPGCDALFEVNVSVVQGNLVQRAYTGGVNPNATTISLGSIVSPTAPTALNGTLNPITVSDNRGGTFGWSLTAVLSNFSGATGKTINKSRANLTAGCSPATAGTAWDYSAVGQTAVSGYDSFYAATGATSGGNQSFGSAVNLCTKDGTINATTGSTGGIYNATAGVTLLVPAFQASDSYVAVLTVTLA